MKMINYYLKVLKKSDYDLNFLKNIEVAANDLMKINAELSYQISNDIKINIRYNNIEE
jgi:hypothetical protein